MKTYTVEVEKTYRQMLKVKAANGEEAVKIAQSRAMSRNNPDWQFDGVSAHVSNVESESGGNGR